jgi:hypothetical protein
MKSESFSQGRGGQRANKSSHVKPARETLRGAVSLALEELEPRQFLSTAPDGLPWAPFASITGQDVAASEYPYLTGSGISVAIVDRGIDYNDPQLGGGYGAGFKVDDGFNFRDNNNVPLDDYGHGTGVASIIAANGYTEAGTYNQGVAPDASLVDLKQESSANIKQALDWVIANAKKDNIQVLNLTDFITDVKNGAFNPNLYLPDLQTIYNMGIFISSPVGNGESTFGPGLPVQEPASDSPYDFGVGGINLSDQFWDDSIRGTGTQLVAPAADVTMIYYTENPATKGDGFDQFDDNYTGTAGPVNYALGTSWGSAYTAGAATLLKQLDPLFTPAQIATILTTSGSANEVTDPENIDGIGQYPQLNINGAIAMGYQIGDDQFHSNYSIRRAQPISFRRGVAALGDLKLLIGKPDVWAFTLPTNTTFKVTIPFTGTGTAPTASIVNVRGKGIAIAGQSGTTLTLEAGTYYVYLSSPQTILGTYGVNITMLQTNVSRTVGRAIASPNLVQPGGSTVSNSTVNADSSVLGKDQNSVLA